MKNLILLIVVISFIILAFLNENLNKKKEIKQGDSSTAIKAASSTEELTPGSKVVLTDDDGNLTSIGFPKGVIVIFSGSLMNIPVGWTLCDGRNGTPDLRGRFVLGVNPGDNKNILTQRNINDIGGVEKLGIENIPPHQHRYFDTAIMESADWMNKNKGQTIESASNDKRNGGGWKNLSWNSIGYNNVSYDNDNNAIGFYNDTEVQPNYLKGEKQTEVDKTLQKESLPPYLVLAYIMKI